jgi:hypothetical protein
MINLSAQLPKGQTAAPDPRSGIDKSAREITVLS